MLRFVVTRLAVIISTFLGVTLLTFALLRLAPGDPIELMLGERGLTPERHAQMRAELGLDRPMAIQYGAYLRGVLSGDLGRSIVTRTPVLREFLAVFPATVELSVAAIGFALVLGIPFGVLAAVRRGSVFDYATMTISLAGYSMPIFWWGLLLILLFSQYLGITPVSGRIDVLYDVPPRTGFMLIDTLLVDEPGAFVSALHHLVLPAVVLGTIPLATIARMTRSSMLEVLGADYIRTARAKGLSRMRVIGVHALRNALIPVVTVVGLAVGVLLAGAILTETIFAWPGVGKWLIDAVRRRDYPVLQGGILLVASVVIAVNLLVDVLYGALDPRIRHAR
ncbi:MAG: ABC transporter permease subunit [Rhodospirillales bacterium]|nr:ABC transporter permease subunit [Rhodospirillales bacterium]